MIDRGMRMRKLLGRTVSVMHANGRNAIGQGSVDIMMTVSDHHHLVRRYTFLVKYHADQVLLLNVPTIKFGSIHAVSYTHLTLPTNREV